MNKRIITINRMYGSNGRIIGKALAFFTYGKPVRLNFQVTFNPNQN